MDRKIPIEDIVQFVKALFSQYATEELVYHNLHHTEYVVEKAIEISPHYWLNKKQFFIVQVSAWFHDTGHLFSASDLHEEGSVSIMKNYFTDKMAEGIISLIQNCILSTKLPQNPKNLVQKIVCDADLYHLGTDKFPHMNELLRKEIELRTGKEIDYSIWLKDSLNFLQTHQYHTSYCRKLLSKGKAQNIDSFHKLLTEISA